jgi:hypothetical protein
MPGHATAEAATSAPGRLQTECPLYPWAWETNKQNPDREDVSKMAFPNKIRLRADLIAVILALSARLPAMDDRLSSPEIGR